MLVCIIDIFELGVDKLGVKVVVGVVLVVVVVVVVFVFKVEKKVVFKKVVVFVVDGVDDLKKLLGVGLVFEKKLFENGVIIFVQIVVWIVDDIVEFDEKLLFKGCIECEGWVE